MEGSAHVASVTLEQGHNLVVLLGPTASGKTHLGVALARLLAQHRRISCEIISADSRQVFRGMNIGTGKDLEEYGSVPYHLIDIVDPGYEFSVYEFQHRFYTAFKEIHARGNLPMLIGGTGLYLDAIVRGYRLASVAENPLLREELSSWTWVDLEARLRRVRPHQHNTTDLDTRERLIRAIEIAEGEGASWAGKTPYALPLMPLILGLRWERSVLRERITARLRARLEAGLIAEVEALLATGLSHERLAAYGLEYRFVCRYVRGELTWDALFQGLNQAIHKFAKRQATWFRRMERKGTLIHWLDGTEDPLTKAADMTGMPHRFF